MVVSQNALSTATIGRLDIECVLLGVSIRDCSSRLGSTARARVYDKLRRSAGHLSSSVLDTSSRYGAPVTRVQAAVSPLGLIFDGLSGADLLGIAETIDKAAADIGVRAVGGFTALCAKALSASDRTLIESIPAMLTTTERVCASVECASRASGVNYAAVDHLSTVLGAERTVAAVAEEPRLAILANASGASPHLPGAFHGMDEPELSLKIVVNVSDEPLLAHPGAESPFGPRVEASLNRRGRLLRGGSFYGIQLAQLLGKRSGMAIDRSAVSVSLSTPAVNPIVGENGRSVALSSGSRVVKRLTQRWDSAAARTELAAALVGHLSDAVAGGIETEISLQG